MRTLPTTNWLMARWLWRFVVKKMIRERRMRHIFPFWCTLALPVFQPSSILRYKVFRRPTKLLTFLFLLQTLRTEEIGRLVIYVDVLAKSKPILDKKLQHGLVVIPRILTKGSGKVKFFCQMFRSALFSFVSRSW